MKKCMEKLAVLIAPWRDRTPEDVKRLASAKVKLLQHGWLPIFLPDTLGDVLDDSDDEQRLQGLECSAYFVGLLAEHPEAVAVVVGPTMSEGMIADVQTWLTCGGKPPVNIRNLLQKMEMGDGRDD